MSTYLVPIIVAAAGVVLAVAVAVWLIVLLRRFTAVLTVSRLRFQRETVALSAEVTGVRQAIDESRSTGAWRFTAPQRSRTIENANE